jgi:hypothetical protein
VRRFSIVLLGVCFVLLLCSERGHGEDPIADKLEKAKEKYDKDMKKLTVDVVKYFKRADEDARKEKVDNKKKVDQIKEQKQAFDDNLVLPDTAPADLRKQLTAARTSIKKAYGDAISAYTTLKKDALAAAVEKEWKEQENKGVGACTESCVE